MKVTIYVPTEVEIKTVRVEIAVRYGEEDIPNDFPFRVGDMWIATIDIDKGKIIDWPQGKTGSFCMKICDEGSYFLQDVEGKEVLSIESNYVPNALLPGEYGDYLELDIDETGTITNWLEDADLSDFLPEED
jgi:hypothetical protein